MMNKDLIDFTKNILGRYNATPDEWDAFESVKWSMDTTHKITAVFYPQRNEVEATWENIATGKNAGATFPVTSEQGEDIAELIMPCVEQNAACEPPDIKLWDRIFELETCIRQMCNNALDLGYCDMHDCKECKTFKVCGVER